MMYHQMVPGMKRAVDNLEEVWADEPDPIPMVELVTKELLNVEEITDCLFDSLQEVRDCVSHEDVKRAVMSLREAYVGTEET